MGFSPVSAKQLAFRPYKSLKWFHAPLFPRVGGKVASAAVRTAAGASEVVLGGQNGSG